MKSILLCLALFTPTLVTAQTLTPQQVADELLAAARAFASLFLSLLKGSPFFTRRDGPSAPWRYIAE